ncbi:hypothetical protein Emag_002885 [Eimeria magna]
MSSDDLEKLEPDEFLMTLAAEPSILHEDPPHQVESVPGPESAVDPAAEVAPDEDDDEIWLPPKEVPGRCPYAWSPPRRKHERFGFYTGPPQTAQNPVELPIPFRPPHCPFGDPAALIPLRYFAVLPGPGYKAQVMEQYWIVKMSLRDVYREMCYDRACRQLYPERFLRRYMEVFPEPPSRDLPSPYLDLPRSYCLLRDMEEEERGSLRTTIGAGSPSILFASNILAAGK